jgi:hypothetical protein
MGCGGRGGADDERCQSVRRSRLALADVIARGAVETATTHVELRILLEFERHRRQRAVLAARMHAAQSLALGIAELEAGIGHAERGEDVIAQIRVEPLAADRLDRLADEIDVGAGRPRDGRGAWAVLAAASDTKLQHLDTICGGLIAISVTTPGIHDNVIPQRFPTLIFCGKIFRIQQKRCLRIE